MNRDDVKVVWPRGNFYMKVVKSKNVGMVQNEPRGSKPTKVRKRQEGRNDSK